MQKSCAEDPFFVCLEITIRKFDGVLSNPIIWSVWWHIDELLTYVPLNLLNLFSLFFLWSVISSSQCLWCWCTKHETFSILHDKPNGMSRVSIRGRLLKFTFGRVPLLLKFVFWTFTCTYLLTRNSKSMCDTIVVRDLIHPDPMVQPNILSEFICKM